MSLITFKPCWKKKILDQKKTSTIRDYRKTNGKGFRRIPVRGERLHIYIGSRFDSDYHKICEAEVYDTRPIRFTVDANERYYMYFGKIQNWNKNMKDFPPTHMLMENIHVEWTLQQEGFDTLCEMIEFFMPEGKHSPDFMGWKIDFYLRRPDQLNQQAKGK